MKINKLKAFVTAIALAVVPLGVAYLGGGGSTVEELAPDSPRIAWYATLDSGLAEAKRSNRPILFSSAAPSCLGVSGIW